MGKYTLKNISNSVSGKYIPGMLAARQKLFDHSKQSATDAPKTSLKRVIQKKYLIKTDLIGNKIANKLQEFQKIHSKII